jgi:hypothetical protein
MLPSSFIARAILLHFPARSRGFGDGLVALTDRLEAALVKTATAIACALVLLVTASARAQPVPPADSARGTTPESAIMLPDIADEFHGVAAEHTYIAAHFPTWHIEYQTRMARNDRDYDVLGMIKPDQTKAVIYFDITDWIGK